MGNRFSRRRDSPAASSGETAVTAQKPAEQRAAPQPAEEPTQPEQTQEAADTEDLDVVVGEPVTPEACLPSEECISEFKEVQAPAAPATQNDADPKLEAKETPAPPQPELLVSISTPSLPEPEPAAEPESVFAEAHLAPEPAPKPVPEPESEAGTKAESVPEPVSGSAAVPAEVLEQQTDFLSQEILPEPKLFSTTSTDHHVSDLTPQPVNTSPPPAPIPDLDTADEPSDNTVAEGGQDSTEAAQSSISDPEKPEETSESLENPVEMEAAGYLEESVSDVNKESISELLQNLELKGNDLLADLIPSDVNTPNNTPITDAPTSNELI